MIPKYSRKEIFTSVFLYLVFLFLLLFVAVVRGVPGYMDESYYAAGARNLSNGSGFFEKIIWNFIDDPEGLPHPSHLYWMPLVSILSAAGNKIFGNSYLGACIPQAVIAAFIAPCVYLLLSRWLKSHFWSLVGAVVSILGGYYLIYYSAVDAFSLYILFGYGYFAVVAKIFRYEKSHFLNLSAALGVLAGLMHLSRADGILWAGMVPIFILTAAFFHRKQPGFSLHPYLLGIILGLSMYFVIMSPWYYRNLRLFGTMTARGSSRNLFLTTYNDLYSYPASMLTMERWLGTGIQAIISLRLEAAWKNILSLLGVQMLLIQLPFVIFGIWKNWDSAWVKVNLFGLFVTYSFFTVVFPLAGMRGSFFHSSAAFQVFLWCMAIYGLRSIIKILPLRKGIPRENLEKFIAIGFLIIIAAITTFLFSSKLNSWRFGATEITEIHRALDQLEVPAEEIILINDPATFYWVSNRPSIVIPSGDTDTMLSVMQRYGVEYVVLQINHPPELSGLYLAPGLSEDFELIYQKDNWHILKKGD
jgi:hypothetical protein